MGWEVAHGDCIAVMDDMEADSVQCVVTSPPYYGLRAYEGLEPEVWADDWEGCLGNEPDPHQYITHMVEVFDAIKRVLRPDGVAWLNLGDSFYGGGQDGKQFGSKRPKIKWKDKANKETHRRGTPHPNHKMKFKDLMLMPHRTAIALQGAGWYVRMDICWQKPNAMPEPVKDRPTKAHEYVFLLAKGAKYYYDADAVREPHVTFTEKSKMRGGRKHIGKKGGTPERGKNAGNHNLHDGRWDQAFHPKGRNRRSVWTIPTKPYRAAHFAVMPEALANICVLAGSRPGDLVFDPFAGAGTTGVVAKRHGRRFIGAEGSWKYVKMARERIRKEEGAP